MNFKNCVLCIGLLLFAVNAHANSPVFKISKAGQYLYIGGTIHLLSRRDYPLPLAFEQAFKDADLIVFETDIAGIQLPKYQVQIAEILGLPSGRTLEGELSKETYAALAAFLSERQMLIQEFDQMTPAGVSFVLLVMELQRLGLGNPEAGVDQHYSERSVAAAKGQLYLEAIEDQIGFLSAFNQVDANELIKSSIRDMSSLAEKWQVAIDAWRSGDLDTLQTALGAAEMQKEFPALYKLILADRNYRWLDQITPMMETPEVELMLVGALHLVGRDGLIEQLRMDGYKVEQLGSK